MSVRGVEEEWKWRVTIVGIRRRVKGGGWRMLKNGLEGMLIG